MTHAPGVRAVLSSEVSSFLVQLSIYLNQFGAYPANHPVLAGAAQAATLRLHQLLLDRESFAIGVAGDRLLIEGTFTDPAHAVLRDLARHLHRQQLGAVRFWRGVGAHELEDLVAEIAEARRSDRPMERDLGAYRQRWAHIQVESQAWDQLRLAQDEEAGLSYAWESAGGEELAESQRLWMALAAAAMAGEAGIAERSDSAADLARSITLRREDAEYDRVIVEYLLQLGRQVNRNPGQVGPLAARMQDLLGALDAETLGRLLALGATLEQRRELVELVSRDMPVNTVLMMLHAAVAADQQSISHHLLRLLNKLALQAGPDQPDPVRRDADLATRETVRRLLENWKLADPNPGVHTRLLDQLARQDQSSADPLPSLEEAALRIVQMSLEIGVAGPLLREAVDEMLDRGAVRELLDLLQGVGDGGAATEIWNHLATPRALEHLLAEETADPAAVQELITRLGSRAAAPMLDALAAAESRAVRRRLLTWLGHLGGAIATEILERLPTAPWYLQRNLLTLLAGMPDLPADQDLQPYASHGDVRVRREAVKLLLARPGTVGEGLGMALRDSDPQILSMALTVAQEQLPAGATAAVIGLARRRELSSEIRVQAIRALARSRSPQVRACLLELVLARKRWYLPRRLAARTPEALAALNVLATVWREDAEAVEALRLAGRSRDSAVREAIQPLVMS